MATTYLFSKKLENAFHISIKVPKSEFNVAITFLHYGGRQAPFEESQSLWYFPYHQHAHQLVCPLQVFCKVFYIITCIWNCRKNSKTKLWNNCYFSSSQTQKYHEWSGTHGSSDLGDPSPFLFQVSIHQEKEHMFQGTFPMSHSPYLDLLSNINLHLYLHSLWRATRLDPINIAYNCTCLWEFLGSDCSSRLLTWSTSNIHIPSTSHGDY
jgi:hypothetical protein